MNKWKAPRGKILCKPITNDGIEDGILNPGQEKMQKKGIVVAVGDPDPDFYSRWEMFLWTLFRRHPEEIKVGMTVVLHTLKGVKFIDGEEYISCYVTDIPAFE